MSKTITEAQLQDAVERHDQVTLRHGYGEGCLPGCIPSIFAALPDAGLDPEPTALLRALVEAIKDDWVLLDHVEVPLLAARAYLEGLK